MLPAMRALVVGVLSLLGDITEEYFPQHWAMSDQSGSGSGSCCQGRISPRGSVGRSCAGLGESFVVDGGRCRRSWASFPFLKAFPKILLSIAPGGGHVRWWWYVWIHVVLYCFPSFFAPGGFRLSFPYIPGHSVFFVFSYLY